MAKMENIDAYNSMINSKVQNSLNFKFQTFHTNFATLYREKNFISLIEELVDNKNENDYDRESKLEEYISFCNGEYTITETKPN